MVNGKQTLTAIFVLFLCGCSGDFRAIDSLGTLGAYESPSDNDSFDSESVPNETPQPEPEKPFLWPAFDWDGKHADSLLWNQWAYEAVEDKGSNLLNELPSDVSLFCPNYSNLNHEDQKFFWISLVAAMARFESSFRPETTYQEEFRDRFGELIISRGLLQLSIESSRGYGCVLENAQQLHNVEDNLHCTIKILNLWVGRDGSIAGKKNGTWQGGARYWAVLRRDSIKNQIIKKTSESSICQAD